MEVKINSEIRAFRESVFFGLNLRQLIFAILAMAVAVVLFFLLKDSLGIEMTSWFCIIGAAPFALIGFVNYNGMVFEKFIAAWFRSEFLMPERLVFKAENFYYNMFEQKIIKRSK